MRTIAFYSYKGGQGKSLMAANLAVCLSRLRKNSVLVDLDLDAPSLHNKIEAGEPALGSGGIVQLINNSIRFEGGKEWDDATLADIEFAPVRDVALYSYVLDDPREKGAAGGRSDYGSIRLFAAGNIYKDDYWKVVWSALWRDIFTVVDREERQKATPQDVAKVGGFLKEIKRRIQEIDRPSPDYLIVDCRSGSSALTTTIINAWLDNPDTDSLVYAFSFNEDNITYLDRFVREHRSELSKRIRLALCRVPQSIEYRGDRKLMAAIHKLDIDWDDLNVIRSDRDLERSERVRLGLHAPPDPGGITQDYLKLFEKLIPREDWLGQESLALAIGLQQEEIDVTERVFNLDVNAGALTNPNDGTRNVAFKVETFQLLLQGLQKGIDNLRETEKPDGAGALTADAEDSLQRLLYHAGTQCGQRFGESLAADLAHSAQIGAQERILRWCHFDSDVGFGRFDIDPETIHIRGTRLLHCDVLLRDSFLTPERRDDQRDGLRDVEISEGAEHKYCELMRGYVKGVLERLLNVAEDTLTVTHQPLEDDIGSSASCKFVVDDTTAQTRR